MGLSRSQRPLNDLSTTSASAYFFHPPPAPPCYAAPPSYTRPCRRAIQVQKRRQLGHGAVSPQAPSGAPDPSQVFSQGPSVPAGLQSPELQMQLHTYLQGVMSEDPAQQSEHTMSVTCDVLSLLVHGVFLVLHSSARHPKISSSYSYSLSLYFPCPRLRLPSSLTLTLPATPPGVRGWYNPDWLVGPCHRMLCPSNAVPELQALPQAAIQGEGPTDPGGYRHGRGPAAGAVPPARRHPAAAVRGGMGPHQHCVGCAGPDTHGDRGR